MKRVLAVLLFVVILVLGYPGHGSAHPLDRLRQHLLVDIAPESIDFTLAIGGGVLATEVVEKDLDPDLNGTVEPAEAAAFAEKVLHQIDVAVGTAGLAIEPDSVEVILPDIDQFRLGLEPVMVRFSTPLPLLAEGEEAHLAVGNRYRLDRTDFLFDAQSEAGVVLGRQGWPGSVIRIDFRRDAAAPGTTSTAIAEQWSGSGIIEKTQRIFSGDRSASGWMVMLGIFTLMGALHAATPGHGKALAAAYLAASDGKPRDAFALAGIVTLTHTASVYALAGATVLASQVFAPSRVIPAMQIVSGGLVALLGLMMLRGTIQKRRAKSTDSQNHHHHHDEMTDEEHARFHAEEALQIQREGKRSFRGLALLGVSGGMVPCPDALAILLLAIGMNQLPTGLVAIAAFSLGLAGVLVAFGVAVVLAKPAASGLRQRLQPLAGGVSRFDSAGSVAIRFAPVASAMVVTVLGLAMLTQALAIS